MGPEGTHPQQGVMPPRTALGLKCDASRSCLPRVPVRASRAEMRGHVPVLRRGRVVDVAIHIARSEVSRAALAILQSLLAVVWGQRLDGGPLVQDWPRATRCGVPVQADAG